MKIQHSKAVLKKFSTTFEMLQNPCRQFLQKMFFFLFLSIFNDPPESVSPIKEQNLIQIPMFQLIHKFLGFERRYLYRKKDVIFSFKRLFPCVSHNFF